MTDPVRITTLVENTAQGCDMLAEHGLAFWIEFGTYRILFDTGQSNILMRNARHLDIDLSTTDAIVLSHGHYDHTGGLNDVLRIAKKASVFAHPEAFAVKYAQGKNGVAREIGVRDAIDQFTPTAKPTMICPGLYVTGQIPRRTDYEDTGGRFFLDKECRHPDPLNDDQAIYFESTQGIVVLLGCAHSGVINILEYVRELTGNHPLHAVMGGMHLLNASQKRMDQTIEALRGLNINLLAAAHCTGMAATVRMWSEFAGQCTPCNVGTTMEFEIPDV